MPMATDTTPEIERAMAYTFGRMPMAQKWRLVGEMFMTARSLHAAGVRLRQPATTPADIHRQWLATTFGYRCLELGEFDAMDESSQNLTVLSDVVRVLTDLGIVHALGGSMASSLHGVARFTRDADLSVEPFPGKEDAFAAALGKDYYLSLPAMRQAIANRSTFNVLDTHKGFKVDVFIRKDQEFDKSALERRILVQLPGVPERPLAVLTAEDVVLYKLLWYRLGDEVSTQQWNDVLGIMRVQAGHMDDTYLDRWAAIVNVADLLTRARAEV